MTSHYKHEFSGVYVIENQIRTYTRNAGDPWDDFAPAEVGYKSYCYSSQGNLVKPDKSINVPVQKLDKFSSVNPCLFVGDMESPDIVDAVFADEQWPKDLFLRIPRAIKQYAPNMRFCRHGWPSGRSRWADKTAEWWNESVVSQCDVIMPQVYVAAGQTWDDGQEKFESNIPLAHEVANGRPVIVSLCPCYTIASGALPMQMWTRMLRTAKRMRCHAVSLFGGGGLNPIEWRERIKVAVDVFG